MVKAILFDFNGVIIDDEPIQMRAYQEIFKAEGVEMTEEDYYSCMGMNDAVFVREIFGRAKKEISDEKIEELSAAKTAKWREIIDKELPIFDGVVNFVKKSAKDFALGVVSMAKREEIEYVLDKADLRSYFPVIISAEDVATWKPHPDCYLKGFNQIDSYRIEQNHLPMVHGETLVIEDAPRGIEAGKRAGMKTLGITSAVTAEILREAGADAVSKDLKDWMPESIRRVFV
jgi:HAD superfamily hydrolase (TIGR01509 family)